MKSKLKLLLISFFFVSTNSISQTTPWILGGQNTSGQVIGTLNAQPFTIRTADLDRVTIDTLGNLGIGTVTPEELLDVDGNINIAADQWYGIDGNRILANEGTNNIFVGQDAGISIAAGLNNTFVGVNSGEAMEGGSLNVFVGFNTGVNMQDGIQNVFLGARAGVLSTGDNNVMVGFNAGTDNTDGEDNVFVGSEAGANNTTGDNNVFIGFEAGMNNTEGWQNLFIGSQAGEDNISGNSNTFIGFNAGQNNVSGTDNMFLGMQAGFANDTGSCNVYIGREAAFHSTGNRNMAIGEAAGWRSTGNDNVYMGFRAGITESATATTGSGNTMIGRAAGDHGNDTYIADNVTLIGSWANTPDSPTSLTNATAIGHRAFVEASNALVLGSIANTNGAGAGDGTNVGIGTTTPDNRLEVVEGTSGESGLRLTSLAGSTAGTPNGEVLSIDSNGDVILVKDGGSGIGNYCNETQDTLAGNYEIPLNDYNWYFTGSTPYVSGVNTSGIGIGVACGGAVYGKLGIEQDQPSFFNGTEQQSVGVSVNVTDTTAGDAAAVVGYSNAVRSNKNMGGDFISGNAGVINVGVEAKSRGTDGTSDNNYGGFFFAEDADENIGVYAEASNGDTTGVGDWAGYFNGNVMATGVYYDLSDENLKRDIEPIALASEQLSLLNPVRYNFRTEQYPTIHLSPRSQLGLIAQEVAQVIPQVVGNVTHPAQYDNEGNLLSERIDLKGVNYTQLIPLLIAGFNEQQSLNAQLNSRVEQLEQQLQQIQDCIDQSQLCTGPQQRLIGVGNQTMSLENYNAIVLDQNLPNPFAERTTITYALLIQQQMESILDEAGL